MSAEPPVGTVVSQPSRSDNDTPSAGSPARDTARRSALRYVGYRLALMPIGLLLLVSVTFVLTNVLPADPARSILGSFATPEQLAATRERLGLDSSLGVQYLEYLNRLVHLDFGESYFTSRPVLADLGSRLASTLLLGLTAIALAVVYGLALGAVGAYFGRRPVGRLSRLLTTLHQSIPEFAFALVASVVLFSQLGWLPAPTGQLSFDVAAPPRRTGAAVIDGVLAGDGEVVVDGLLHLVLPATAVGLFIAAAFSRLSHGLLDGVLRDLHMEYARSLGLRRRTMVYYALRCIAAPLLTYVAIAVASLVGSLAVIETMFNWQGVGQWAVDSILKGDLPVIQGIVLLSGALTLVTYFLGDIAGMLVDPRVRLGVGR